MVEIKRAGVEDAAFIRGLYSDPEIFDAVSDDYSPKPSEIDYAAFLESPLLYALIPMLDGQGVGCLVFIPWNGVTYELHTIILPAFRGKTAVDAAKAAGQWMFDHTRCMKVVTHVPMGNLPAITLAIRCGMKQEGINRRSYLKNGKLIDQYIYGFSKEADRCP